MGMVVKSLFDQVIPRQDVLAGELTESRFAASLEDVVSGSAAEAYADADHFFAATYPSGGLKTLLNEALGRIGGGKPDGASVLRLETSLGGGKTHNLIALFHAARGHLDRVRAGEFMDPALLPDGPVEQVGVFVGTTAGARSFPAIDGVRPHTVWGSLALQVGGTQGYELVKADDEALTAPGSAALRQLFGDRPVLLLIDEIARYYSVAKGVRVGDSTLASQTTAFLMALMEAVDGLAHAVLVITTTGLTDAFGEDTADVLKAVEEAGSLMARKEVVLRPSEETDLPKILARRLFESIAPGAATETARAYAQNADDAYASGLDQPEHMMGSGWAGEINRTYPFHPALIKVMDKRLSTIPNFQRTRGALRLLARVVRRLWEQRPADTALVHLHDIDLSERVIAEELSSRLERSQFEAVIRTDIRSQREADPAHAEQVDNRMAALYARRIATTIYLYSLTRESPGVPAPELYASTLQLGDDPNLVQKALDALENVCWYLHGDARGYRFSTEASLVRLIQEAEGEVSVTRARTRATKILAEKFKDSNLRVRRAWEDAKVPDNADDAWLVLLHWDDFGDKHGVGSHDDIPDKVRQLWERTPSGGVREYRNRLVILAPTAATHRAMLRTVTTYLALQDLADNADTLAQLTPEKRAEVRDKVAEQKLQAVVAVCNHVNLLYVAQASGLEPVQLDQVTTASVKPNQTDAIVERLAAMDKTLVAGDKPLDPHYIRRKLGTLLDTPQPTNELVKVFARRTDLKMVLDRGELRGLIGDGVRKGVWEYQDPERGDDGWATREAPAAAFRLSDDTLLHPPGSAPEPAVEACPFCGEVHPGRGCPDDDDSPGPGPGPEPGAGPVTFSGTGAAGAAFAQARAAAAEAQRSRLRRLKISVDHIGQGAGTELARLHTVIPAGVTGASLVYHVDASATLGDNPDNTVQVTFRGTPADYAPLRDALRQVLAPREAVVKASVEAIFGEPLEISGSDVEKFAQSARDTGPTKCAIEMRTEADGDGT